MTGGSFPPASSSQRRLWLLDQLSPGSAEYNIAWSVRLTGPLSVPALEAALSWLVARHEALRTSFAAVDGEPVQRIGPPTPVRLPVVDLRVPPGGTTPAGTGPATTAAGPAERAEQIAARDAGTAFDLATGPLLRARLLRSAEHDHLLVLVVHHIVSDGWSFGVIFDELAQAYRATLDGEVPELPAPPIQYADFALWQRERSERGAFAADLEFWRAELAGAPTLLDLPADRIRPAEQTAAGGLHTFALPDDLTAAVRALARDADTSVFAVLLGGFQALLHRITGAADLLVGVPVSGRTRPETAQVVGFFANTLALRARFDERTSFTELLGAARAAAVAAQARQDVPFEQIVDLLSPRRSLAHSPVVQVMFALDEPPPAHQVGGLRITPLLLDNGTVKFDLTLTVEQWPDGLRGRLTYRSDLFDADRIRRLARHYVALLAGATAAPATAVAELPLLDEAARRELSGAAAPLAAPPYSCVAELLAARPPADPDAVAVSADGDLLTHRRLNADSNRLAHLLRSHGVGPDTPVGLCLSRGTAMVTALLAIWKAGGGYLPLDPQLPPDRLAGIAAAAGIGVLITDRTSAARTGDICPPGTRTIRLDGTAETAALRARPETPPRVAGHPQSLAYLLYTSGSTGAPKGVAVTQGAVVNLLAGLDRRLRLTVADRVAAVTTLSFDISVVEVVLPLLAGARIEVFDTATARDAAALRAGLAARRVTVGQATPATWRMLLAAGGVPAGVRLRISGGEALPRDLADALTADGATLINGYGPSETTIYSTFGPVDPHGPVDLGDPVANTRLYLLDPAGRPVPVGAVGELHIGGLGVGRGYHGRPGLTAASFRPDPHGSRPGARLYATGDLARWLSNGRLEYLGRADHQIKLRGYRIEPGEIEVALREQPGISDAVVTTWRAGPDDVRLVGYVVPTMADTDPALLDPALLWARVRPALARRLPDYMLPATLVVLDRLPRTGSGKIDRRALPEPSWRDPGGDAADGPEPARDPDLERLTGLWCEVLGRTGIGTRDNFFALGGHSLTATRLIARIRDAFGVELPLRALFAAPTIAELGPAIALLAPATTRPSPTTTHPTSGVPAGDRVGSRGPTPQDLLASLDDLSDREIDELLDTLIAEEGA